MPHCRPTAKAAHQKAALGALAALLTCGNGLPEPLLRVVWDSIGQAVQAPGKAVAEVLGRGSHVEQAWRFLEAASLHPWAIAELLQADELHQVSTHLRAVLCKDAMHLSPLLSDMVGTHLHSCSPQALIARYGLEEDADESRKQALQNFAHVITMDASFSRDPSHIQLVEQIKRAL